MTLVVDASVALKWFVEEENTTRAVAVLAREDNLIAPTLVIAELCNAAWRLWRRGEIAIEQVRFIAQRSPPLFAELVPEQQLANRASEIALALEHPAYDCFYIALAENEGGRLMTADKRLIKRLRGTAWERRTIALDAWS